MGVPRMPRHIPHRRPADDREVADVSVVSFFMPRHFGLNPINSAGDAWYVSPVLIVLS